MLRAALANIEPLKDTKDTFELAFAAVQSAVIRVSRRRMASSGAENSARRKGTLIRTPRRGTNPIFIMFCATSLSAAVVAALYRNPVARIFDCGGFSAWE